MNNPRCRSCNAPGSKQRIRCHHVYGGGRKHKFWQCTECQLVYLWPIPSETEEKYFYASEFEKFMSARAARDRDWSGAEAHIKSNQDNVSRRMRWLRPYVRKGRSILEIGCSSGFMLQAFKRAGLKAMGIEPSEKFTDFLTARGFTVYKDTAQLNRAEPEAKFDLIVHFFVLEHIRHPREFISEQLNLLKPGGRIIAEVPCVNDPLTSLYTIPAFEKFYWSIAHHYYFNPASLTVMLRQVKCNYRFIPEQRYDLSNHLVWMQEGKPGGQGRYNHVFSPKTIKQYSQSLKNRWLCDTFLVHIWK